jgi:hypothetical protein
MIDRADDEICNGPNRGYSLNQARANFRAHGHMYDADRASGYLQLCGTGREPLMAYVRSVRSGATALDQATLDRLIAEDRDSWPWRQEPYDAAAHEHEEALLRVLLKDGPGMS